MKRLLATAGLLLVPSVALQGAEPASSSSAAHRMERYNVVWGTPSKDASGVMPIGNGDIAAGVYAIENSDLFLLLAKNDAYNYQGDLYKTGRVRVTLAPNPFKTGKPFRQTLDLATGSIYIEADGVTLRIWADAHAAVFHVQIRAPHDIAVTASPELWKRFDHTSYNETKFYSPSVIDESLHPPPQDVRLEHNGKILWHYSVGDHSVFSDDLKFYAIEHMAGKFHDPYRFNTFGNLLECAELTLKDGALTGSAMKFDLRIHALTLQTRAPAAWVATIEQQAEKSALPVDDRWARHCAWWSAFWDRGWIVASDNSLPTASREKLNGAPSPNGRRVEEDGGSLVAQNYNMFRFLMACQSRGRVQTKFNGGLFTQQLRLPKTDKRKRTEAAPAADGTLFTHEDDRLWGRRFTFQNQRLLYWPLLASGDFDLMQPFFSYYSDLLPVRAAITRAWFGHAGAYFRENIEPTGAERDCNKDGRPPKTLPGERSEGWYHDYYFTSGLETTAMMLDYAAFTNDAAFRDNILVPFARQVLLFFDQHYPREANGRLRIDPGQVVETFWSAVNASPDIAGLRFCLNGLIASNAGSAGDQARWRKFRSEIPPIPTHLIAGRPAIAPAATWANKRNSENGELYPVFPFRCFGLGLGSADVVSWTMEHRTNKDAFSSACWTQDQIDWAYAGNAAEARDGLVRRFRVASTMCRFPLYGREGPDSCPDFDHLGSGAIALQRMLVQEHDDKVFLLPAWPADWDTDFKLHLSHHTTVTGTVKDGKLTHWTIDPASRTKDVITAEPQVTKTR